MQQRVLIYYYTVESRQVKVQKDCNFRAILVLKKCNLTLRVFKICNSFLIFVITYYYKLQRVLLLLLKHYYRPSFSFRFLSLFSFTTLNHNIALVTDRSQMKTPNNACSDDKPNETENTLRQ